MNDFVVANQPRLTDICTRWRQVPITSLFIIMLFTYIRNILSALRQGNRNVLSCMRYFGRWKESLRPGSSSVADRQPWITYPVIDQLKSFLKPTMRVFEYGGGGSTLFFLDHVQEVVTVEHHQAWFSRLDSMLTADEKSRWNGNFLPGEALTVGRKNPADPLAYLSTDSDYQAVQFQAYASYIDRFPSDHFDLVLVDGRARPSCILHAIPRIKSGGWLIVDNSDRGYYFEQVQLLLDAQFTPLYNTVAPSPYADFFTQTGIWQKR